MKNIFDLEKTDDLPKNIKNNLRRLNVRDDTRKLLDLFEIKNMLTIDEISVGLFRQFKIEKQRNWISSTLYNLHRKNVLKMLPGRRGVYELVGK